jgi:hypothetical protein
MTTIVDVEAEIQKLLSQASYHYADDSTKEWQKADRYLYLAADKIIEYQLPHWRIKQIVLDAKGLVDPDTLVSIVIKRLYSSLDWPARKPLDKTTRDATITA